MNKRTTTDFLIGVGLLAATPVAAWLIQKTVAEDVVIAGKPDIHAQIAMGDVADPTGTQGARTLAVQEADNDDTPSSASDDVSQVVGAN
jgi:hypothetical protein